jgi:hypothetical protein
MTTFADRITSIVSLLCAALGAFGRRIAHPPQPVWLGSRCHIPILEPERLPPLPIPAWNLFIARIQRTANRIQTLFAQWRNGTLKPTRRRLRRDNTQPTPSPCASPAPSAGPTSAPARSARSPACSTPWSRSPTPGSS